MYKIITYEFPLSILVTLLEFGTMSKFDELIIIKKLFMR